MALCNDLQVLRKASEGVFVPLTVGGGIREFTDPDGTYHSALDVAAEYFRSGADKVSIGGDAVLAAEEYYAAGKKKSGKTAIEQISWVCDLPCLKPSSSAFWRCLLSIQGPTFDSGVDCVGSSCSHGECYHY